MRWNLFLFIMSFLVGSSSGAGAPSPGSLFTYEGVLTDSSGNPITTPQTVQFEILSGTCVLYKETQTVIPGSLGEFSVVVGAGSRTDTTSNTADRIFASSGTADCSGSGTVSFSGFNGRNLRINVEGVTLSPDVVIGNIPFAHNAQRLGDKSASDFVSVNGAKGVNQANVESIFDRFTKLDAILNKFDGTSIFSASITGNAATATTATTATNVSGTVAVSNGGTGATTAASARTNLGLAAIASSGSASDLTSGQVPVARLGTGTADNTTYLRGDGTWATVSASEGDITSVVAGEGLTGGGTSGAVTLNLSSVGTAGTYVKVTTDSHGRVTNGTPSLVDADIPSLDASKIVSGTLPDARLSGMSVDKVTSATGKYFTYKPNGVSCANNEVLKYDSLLNSGNGGWKCASDDGDAAPLSGDVTGSQSDTVVSRINGVNVSAAVAGDDQKFLKFINGSGWQPANVKLSELKNSVGGSAFNVGTCGSSQTLAWSSLTDQFSCQAIQVDASQVTGNVVKYIDESGAMRINNTTGGFRFYPSSLNPVVITSLGKLGISREPSSIEGHLDIDALISESGKVINRTKNTVGTSQSQYLGYRSFDGYSDAQIPSGSNIALFGGANADIKTPAGMSVVATELHQQSLGYSGMKLSFNVVKNQTNTSYTAMTIDHNGYVGIGLNTPVSPLDIQGSIMIRKSSDGTPTGSIGHVLGMLQILSTPDATSGLRLSSSATAPVILATQGGTVEAMRIQSDGKIGIGTTAPKATLDINGQVRLVKSYVAPMACNSSTDGTIALTGKYTLCVCKFNNWVHTSDGTSNCEW